jgi:hypothetical protein
LARRSPFVQSGQNQGKPGTAPAGDSGLVNRNNVLTGKDRAVFLKLMQISQQLYPEHGGKMADFSPLVNPSDCCAPGNSQARAFPGPAREGLKLKDFRHGSD